VHAGATLEWLPQESIIFDGAIARLHTRVDLETDASFFGWDVVCLGRSAAGERFARGSMRQSLQVARDGAEIFVERTNLAGGDALLASAVGLNGAVVFGTFIAAVSAVPDSLVAICRAIAAAENEGEVGVTRMRGCLVGRYRGMSAQSARAYFVRLWCAVRPIAIRRDAVIPRIWAT
jgi:urease accessory protein